MQIIYFRRTEKIMFRQRINTVRSNLKFVYFYRKIMNFYQEKEK